MQKLRKIAQNSSNLHKSKCSGRARVVNAHGKNQERLHKIAQTCTNPSALEERGLLMQTAKLKKDCTK